MGHWVKISHWGKIQKRNVNILQGIISNLELDAVPTLTVYIDKNCDMAGIVALFRGSKDVVSTQDVDI